jgi:hypothetical protein
MIDQADIDNTLDHLELYADKNGHGREQACFHGARVIRALLAERVTDGPSQAILSIEKRLTKLSERWEGATGREVALEIINAIREVRGEEPLGPWLKP